MLRSLLFIVSFCFLLSTDLFFSSCGRAVKPSLEDTTSVVAEMPERFLTITFSGDMMQHLPQVNAARVNNKTFDYSRNFAYIDTLWKRADFAIVNFETTISTDSIYSGYPLFHSPREFADAIYTAGVDVMALANNHCLDGSSKGVHYTIKTLHNIGFKTTGVYSDSLSACAITMLCKNKFRVALLNYTYGTNGLTAPKGVIVNLIDSVKIARDILRAKNDSLATHLIAFIHWGQEYQRKANREQIKLGLWCRKNGVDVVVGSHPHVVQNIDTTNRIVYSLGNFISNQQDKYTDEGMTLHLTLSSKKEPTMRFVHHRCERNNKVRKERYRVIPIK